MINVTKTFLPPFEEYTDILKRAWDKAWITNNGELSHELEKELRSYLGVKNLLFCNNGTTVLQMAIKALGITGEVITTPFSYVATTTAILWENCTPVFVDIDDRNFCIDPFKIEAAITKETQAILATHVYGYPCDVLAIEAIAEKHGLKVIYDAAHAFGTRLNGRSIIDYGNISTCSFHATKIFHTGEGGCLVTRDEELNKKLYLYCHFGHIGDEYISIGINGKNSEFHSALGLCNLRYIDRISLARKTQWLKYAELLQSATVQMLDIPATIGYNYAYFPIVFPDEQTLLHAINILKTREILPRRYFYPSLNTLSYINRYQPCPISESVSKRVICLPLSHDLLEKGQEIIATGIFESLK